MNQGQKRDISYTFSQFLPNSLSSQIIDDNWRKEKFTNLDIILQTSTIQDRLSQDDELNRGDMNGYRGDNPGGRDIPISQKKRWDDLCMNEMLNQYVNNDQILPSINQSDQQTVNLARQLRN